MSDYCFNLYASHATIVDEEQRPYATLHVAAVQSEVQSDDCPDCVETVHEIVEFPQHSTGFGNTYQQTDLHYMVRNGMALPTVSAFIDSSDKTQVLSDTKRMLNGFINSQPSKPEVSPEPSVSPEPTV